MKKNYLEHQFSNIHQGLIDKSLEGDENAQSRLYMLYSKAMYNSCLRITNDEDDAKDVLQEAFISAFRNLNTYKGEASFGAWLERIVVNMVREAIQKLPKGYRVVFSLYLLEGYDHQEIADILGITVSTSKSQYNRAKKKLREILTEEAHDQET